MTLDPSTTATPVSGRLIVFLAKGIKRRDRLEAGFGAEAPSAWLVAREVTDLKPGDTIEIDATAPAFPGPLYTAPRGDYQIQALLDVDHRAAYHAFQGGDISSPVMPLPSFSPGSSAAVVVTLDRRVSEASASLPPRTEVVDFISPTLSKFWGRPIHMRAAVVLPVGYTRMASASFPTVYVLHGFSSVFTGGIVGYYAAKCSDLGSTGKLPPMIQVVLDETCPGGTHEFADSACDGPWGTALVAELIPYLERRFRMVALPRARFVTGHSSGGWAALWLQINHPTFFGGAWATSPDPVDFHDFLGANLVDRPSGNLYRDDRGTPRPFMRMDGAPVQSLQDFAQQEAVLGDFGGQMQSFEWVFSPRGPGGRPRPLFDRRSGAIFPEVARAWEAYDISAIVRKRWKRIGPALKGKIHVTVGEDAFYLDRPVRLLERVLERLGARATFTYQSTRTHVNLFMNGNLERFEREMVDTPNPPR